MLLGVTKEVVPGERRVSVTPAELARLAKAGIETILEAGAGNAAGFDDQQYVERGATVVSRDELFSRADLVAAVRCLGAAGESGAPDLRRLRAGQLLIGTCDPLGSPQGVAQLAETGASLFALEMIPRITRAQSMDVLSSMATVAGYRAVLLAAYESPRMFPMLMTAAGTLAAARVLVLGVGVAGLQAIATARRLGGVVRAYDVRPDCREQVESLGAKFVELAIDAGAAQDERGYARKLDDSFYERQRELLGDVVAESDVVITTAAIPGKRSPLLVDRRAVERMGRGGVIVDLAAERGGNCELSRPDERVEHRGVVILGPTNLPSEAPLHASQMFSRNLMTLLLHVVKQGRLELPLNDPIVSDTLVAHEGQVRSGRLRDLLGLPPLAPADAPASEAPGKTSA